MKKTEWTMETIDNKSAFMRNIMSNTTIKHKNTITEEVLDKIRDEIMQLDYDIESVDYDYNDMPQTEEVHTICREEVLQIIDKYKAESENT